MIEDGRGEALRPRPVQPDADLFATIGGRQVNVRGVERLVKSAFQKERVDPELYTVGHDPLVALLLAPGEGLVVHQDESVRLLKEEVDLPLEVGSCGLRQLVAEVGEQRVVLAAGDEARSRGWVRGRFSGPSGLL